MNGIRNIWRREWDSNPRYSLKYTRFPSVRLKPLGHLSGEQADCMNLTYLRLSLSALRQPIGPQESGVWQWMKAHTPEHALIYSALLPSGLRTCLRQHCICVRKSSFCDAYLPPRSALIRIGTFNSFAGANVFRTTKPRFPSESTEAHRRASTLLDHLARNAVG